MLRGRFREMYRPVLCRALCKYRFQARRLRAEDTHVVARTTVVNDSTTDKLTLDEARLLAVQFDHGLPAFPEPRVTLNQARLDAIWRKFPHISDSERNFKQGP